MKEFHKQQESSASPEKLNADRSENFLDRLMGKNFDLYC
jgi:hypothetical protein